MKATITFDLDEPGERTEHIRCIKAIDLSMAIYDLDQYLRTKTKYESDGMPAEVYEAYESMRDKFKEILEERHISYDELIN